MIFNLGAALLLTHCSLLASYKPTPHHPLQGPRFIEARSHSLPRSTCTLRSPPLAPSGVEVEIRTYPVVKDLSLPARRHLRVVRVSGEGSVAVAAEASSV